MYSLLILSINVVIDEPIQYPTRYVRSAYYSNIGKGTSIRVRPYLTHKNLYHEYETIIFQGTIIFDQLTKLEFGMG